MVGYDEMVDDIVVDEMGDGWKKVGDERRNLGRMREAAQIR